MQETKYFDLLYCYCYFISSVFFLLTLGPKLPKGLSSFSMLEIQGDVFIFGGYGGNGYQSSIHQLSCSSGLCSWKTLSQQLKVARQQLIAIPVPDSFCT